ncbi:MAG: type II secretion system protein [Acidimicrobiales bacterium]
MYWRGEWARRWYNYSGVERSRSALGFTLIELLIVIAVLGILAAIVIFGLEGITGQAASAACNADAKTVSVAVNSYEAQNAGVAPDSMSALSQGSSPYLQSLPTSPYYSISLANGVVMVAAPTSATPVPYSSADACAGADTSSSATTSSTSTTSTTSTTTTTTTLPPSNGVVVAALRTPSAHSGKDVLTITNSASVTALTATIDIEITAGLTYSSKSNKFPAKTHMKMSEQASGDVLIYTFTITGSALAANSNASVTAKWSGSAHPVSGDTYSVVSTSGGVTSTVIGSF